LLSDKKKKSLVWD